MKPLPNPDDTIRTFMSDLAAAEEGDERAIAVVRSLVRQLLDWSEEHEYAPYTVALGKTALELMKLDMKADAEAN